MTAWPRSMGCAMRTSDPQQDAIQFRNLAEFRRDRERNADRILVWAIAIPALIVWGKNNPAFIAAGDEAYLGDLPDVELHRIDAGHLAVEEQPEVVAEHVLGFMKSQGA